MKKTLSVIIPVYNTEQYLKRALDSVLGQTFAVHEIICIDDGSTDGSPEILNEYAKQDKRIIVLRQENSGSTSARKAGILKARGSYLAFVDSDDYIEPEMYEKLMELAVKHDADLVTSGLIRDYGNGYTINKEQIETGLYTREQIETAVLPSLIDTVSFYKTSISPSLCNKIFKAAKFKPVQQSVDDRIRVGDDDAVIYPFLFRCETIFASGKNYYHYCIRENGSNLGMKKKNDMEAYGILLKYLEKEFKTADRPGLNLVKQFQLLKTYFFMLRFPSEALSYQGGVLYPFGKIKKTDKILLYGAGKFGAAMKSYLEEQGFFVVGWADKSADRPGIIRPHQIPDIRFDFIIITVLIADAVHQIRNDLKKLRVPEKQILFIDTMMINT